MNDESMNTDSHRIIVPWDFSDQAKAALKYARRRFSNRSIRVLCVLEPPNPYALGFCWKADCEADAARICAEDFAKECGVRKPESIHFEVQFGDPADEIVRYAKTNQAELIVMSTRGKTGLQKIMLGSVAQEVLRRASCPVVVLPALWCESMEQHIESENIGALPVH